MFKKADKMIEQIFSKYQTMVLEIDKVYVEITKYQDEMKKSIGTLDGLYEQNLKYYLDLEVRSSRRNAIRAFKYRISSDV